MILEIVFSSVLMVGNVLLNNNIEVKEDKQLCLNILTLKEKENVSVGLSLLNCQDKNSPDTKNKIVIKEHLKSGDLKNLDFYALDYTNKEIEKTLCLKINTSENKQEIFTDIKNVNCLTGEEEKINLKISYSKLEKFEYTKNNIVIK